MTLYFPTIDYVREVFRTFRPKDLEAFERETGIKTYWVSAFIVQGPGSKLPAYERIVTIIQWLHKHHGVTFLDGDTYMVSKASAAA